MNSRSKLTLSLFCVVVGLTIFFVSTKTTERNISLPTVSKVFPDSIENIAIERPGKETIQLAKSNNRWQITAPIQLDANPARVSAILRILQAPSFAQLSAKDVNLSTLRLEKPETTLRLNEYVFSFGDTEAINDRRYVMFANRIHLIEDQLYHFLRQNPLFFANPKLLRKDLSLAELIHPEYRLHKEDTWLIATTEKTTQEGAEQLLRAWYNAEAQSVGSYSVRENLGNISAKTTQGKTITFFIMSKEPTLILARPDLGIEYHLDVHLAKQLFPGNHKPSTNQQ